MEEGFDFNAFYAAVSALLIALLGWITTAVKSRSRKLEKQEAQKETQIYKHEVKETASMLSFTDFLAHFTEITSDLNHLFESTCIDRFLLLRAWNGLHDPRWTNAIYQFRKGKQEPVQYQHIELDDDYVNRLNTLIAGSRVVFAVKDIPDSLIKKIYQNENVTHSAWFLVGKKPSGYSKDRMLLTYCSFATHSGIEVDPATLLKCELIVGKLRSMHAQ